MLADGAHRFLRPVAQCGLTWRKDADDQPS